MKLMVMVIGILLMGMFSGCLEITPRNNRVLSSDDNVQPWKDGTVTIQSIQYNTQYSPIVGDYKTVEVWIKVNYSVYVNTEMGGFMLTTNKGTECGWWECQIDGRKYSSVGVGWIPFSRADSPGNFSVHMKIDGKGEYYGLNLKLNENVTSLTFKIHRVYDYFEYTIPINEK